METQQPRDVLQAVADEQLKTRYGHLPVGSQMYQLADVVFCHALDYALNKPGTFGPRDFRFLLHSVGDFLEDLSDLPPAVRPPV
jgi:hypothetical protein